MVSNRKGHGAYVCNLLHGTRDEGGEAFPARLTKDAQAVAKSEGFLAKDVFWKGGVNLLQWMVEGKVAVQDFWGSLFNDEMLVFLRNARQMVADESNPRAIR